MSKENAPEKCLAEIARTIQSNQKIKYIFLCIKFFLLTQEALKNRQKKMNISTSASLQITFPVEY